MEVLNIHERILNVSAPEAGKLIDTLSSAGDRLWPREIWPAMKFDRPLCAGAVGGHGLIRYNVESYEAGKFIEFRFIRPGEFTGTHRFEVEALEENKCALRHIIKMKVSGLAKLKWILVICPLHNALMEDALDKAESGLGGNPVRKEWPARVKFLRRVMSKKRRPGKNPDRKI